MELREQAILKKIRLETGRKINTMFSGEYRSAFKGYGLSFDSVREYIPGDDVRAIDWNVSARMNHLFIKEYVEERELSIVLMIDVSGSTDFGTSNIKRNVILEFVSLILYLAQMNGDRVSLLLFSDRVEKFFRPHKGRKYVLKSLDEIIKCKPSSRETDISLAVEFVQRVMKKKSIVFAISDFIDSGDYLKRLRILSKKHDIIPVQVSDPFESKMNFFGLTEFIDMETGKTFMSDSVPGHVFCPDTGEFDSIKLSTDEPIDVPVLKFFEKRNRSRLV